MRLHFLPDEKIINRTIRYFEKVWPNQNKYIILLPVGEMGCVHVEKNLSNVIVGNVDSPEIANLIKDISQFNSIIVHYLTFEAAILINRIEHRNIMWIEWGGDMYNSFLMRKGFILYTDYKQYLKLKFKFLPYFISKYIIEKRREKQFQVRYNAVKKISYFIPDSMYGEYPLFLSYYPEFSHLKYREFFYYPIQDIVGPENIDRRSKGENIFVGNSASETNNHIDVLQILRANKISNTIIMPLSYGANDSYKRYIIRKGKKYMGKQFRPIVDFLPLKDYNEYLYSCSYFIFANYRQEAVGNILCAFYIGGKVFLRKTNPLYEFYKHLGLILYSLDDINREMLNTPLSKEDYLHNKQIIENKYSSQRLEELIYTSFPDE